MKKNFRGGKKNLVHEKLRARGVKKSKINKRGCLFIRYLRVGTIFFNEVRSSRFPELNNAAKTRTLQSKLSYNLVLTASQAEI